jgi:hypothetical protein
MCCDHTVCSAPDKGVGMPKDAPHAVPHHLNQSLHFGLSERTTRMTKGSMNQLHTGRVSRVTKKSVRQCARRWVLPVDVAQASPLFSDNAPREVHLWQ